MTPLQELQDAIRQFAEKTGFPEPISAVLEMPDGLPSVPIPAKAAAGLPNRQTRKEAIVLQAILSAEEPITLKELIRVTRRSRTFVCEALAALKRRGLVVHDGEGFRAAD